MKKAKVVAARAAANGAAATRKSSTKAGGALGQGQLMERSLSTWREAPSDWPGRPSKLHRQYRVPREPFEGTSHP